MLAFLQKHVRSTWLLLIALFGLASGCLTATILGLNLAPPQLENQSPAATAAPPRHKALADYEIILQRNIFDSTSPGLSGGPAPTRPNPGRATTPRRVDLRLVGTVTGGDEDSMALIEAEKSLKGYRIGDDLPGGGRLHEISRNIVQIDYGDGGISILPLHQEDGTRPQNATGEKVSSGAGIRSLGQNRWLLDNRVVAETRANLGEALKSARMEPRMVDGGTDGFVITMLRSDSLLKRMGFRKGDVVLQINDMPLNSPERALQIFQQLREARSLKVSLERQGQPTLFEYELN